MNFISDVKENIEKMDFPKKNIYTSMDDLHTKLATLFWPISSDNKPPCTVLLSEGRKIFPS